MVHNSQVTKARKRPPISSPVRRLLYSREQTAEVLGGISISSIIRLEREGVLTPIKLHKDRPCSQVFHRVEEVEALAREQSGPRPG